MINKFRFFIAKRIVLSFNNLPVDDNIKKNLYNYVKYIQIILMLDNAPKENINFLQTLKTPIKNIEQLKNAHQLNRTDIAKVLFFLTIDFVSERLDYFYTLGYDLCHFQIKR